MKPPLNWQDLDPTSFSAQDARNWIAVLPVAATEQHGPHLPASTDCDIATAMIAQVEADVATTDLPVTFLPVQEIGASSEHGHTPGTRSRHHCELADEWIALASRVSAHGVRKFVIVSSHGGNTAAADMAILAIRCELRMLAVATAWARFGYPEGLFSETELAYGIHGGDVETSIMLAARPELVNMQAAAHFSSLQETLACELRHLRAYGPHRFGWMIHDLNPDGVTGNAGAATAAKGRAAIRHQAAGFIELLQDVHRFDMDWLNARPV